MEDCSVNPKAFTCPPGFTEVINTEGLCVEDIEDEDQEVWLIQAPDYVDFTNLSDQQLLLPGLTQFQLPSEDDRDDRNEMYECTTVKSSLEFKNRFAKAHLVLPKRSSMKLNAVEKEIQGIVYVQDKVLLPMLTRTKNVCKNVPVPKDLKKRGVSYNSGDPFVPLGENNRSVQKYAADLEKSEVESSGGARKKHSHRVKDLRYFEGNNTTKSNNKHKRDKREQVVKEIKIERTSDDERSLCSDVVASTSGRKNKDKRYKHMDSEDGNLQMSHADTYNVNEVAPRGKKNKHLMVDDEVMESELPFEVAELELNECSSSKPHKKKHKHHKHKTLDSSLMISEGDCNRNSHHKKANYVSGQLEKISDEENPDYHNGSMICVPHVKVDEEITEEHSNELDSSESSATGMKEKSKKKKKKRNKE